MRITQLASQASTRIQARQASGVRQPLILSSFVIALAILPSSASCCGSCTPPILPPDRNADIAPATIHASSSIPDGFCDSTDAASVHGVDLAREQHRLLQGYASFKKYNATPESVRAQLSPDRLAVFDAITRVMFIPLNGEQESEEKKRILNYIYTVTGIWGVRLGDADGRHQFRLTVVACPELIRILEDRKQFYSSFGGHLLKPFDTPHAGDDDPKYDAWHMWCCDLATYRQRTHGPGLQVTYLRAYESIMEIDLDFDDSHHHGQCHGKPSNSDPGAIASDINGHSHIKHINFHAPNPGNPFEISCSVIPDNHCAETYQSYCQVPED